MIILDTSVLIEGLGAGGSMRDELRSAIGRGERLAVPTLVLYEWLRGSRIPEELEAQEAILPRGQALDFGPDEAAIAARLYREVPRARGREIDLAIAANAIAWRSPLWTLNTTDFRDVPELKLVGD